MSDLLTTQFIISQALILIYYALFVSTYYIKGYRKRLLAMMIGNVFMIISYALLGAWTAVPVLIIAICRDTVSIIISNRLLKTPGKKSEPNVGLLILWLSALTIATTFTYQGPLSLFIYFAVMTFTISSWQKSPLVYRVMGIISSIFVIVYNVAVMNIAGIVLEFATLIFIIVGLVRFIANNKSKKNDKKRSKKVKK